MSRAVEGKDKTNGEATLREQYADRVHNSVGDAHEILGRHSLDQADLTLLAEAAALAEKTLATVRTCVDTLPSEPAIAMEHEIAGDISQALQLVERNDLHKLDGAAKAMPEIAAVAKALHARLEQFCDGGPAGEAA